MDYLMNVASTDDLIKAIASWALLNTNTVNRLMGSKNNYLESQDKDAIKDLVRLTEALASRDDFPRAMLNEVEPDDIGQIDES